MSFQGDIMTMDPGAMTEEQQLEWALRMSMQEGGGTSSSAPEAAQNMAVSSPSATNQQSIQGLELENTQRNGDSTVEAMEIDNPAPAQDIALVGFHNVRVMLFFLADA